MYGKMKSRLRDAVSGRLRNTRPAKVRKIRNDIEEVVVDLEATTESSDRSGPEEHRISGESPALSPEHGAATPTEREDATACTSENRDAAAQTITPMSPEDASPLPGVSEVLPESFDKDPDVAENEDPGGAEVENAIRCTRYLLFEGEDETDYTRGPSRLVYAHDGVEQCAGLLMTLESSQKIQAAIHSDRRFQSVKQRAMKRDDANFKFENDLRSHIADHEYRLIVLQEKVVEPSSGDEVAVLEDELAKLHLLMENTAARRRCIDADLENEANNWRETQAEMNAMLEEAFVSAMLLEPMRDSESEDLPNEELTVEKEYELLCRQLQESRGDEVNEIAPLHDYREVHSPLEDALEDQAHSRIKQEFWGAWRDLEAAQAAYDRREEDRARERQANLDAFGRGEHPMDENEDAFDQRWLKRVQELTAKLLQAEEAMAASKAKARDAGVEVAFHDQASGFVDDVDDGYRMSMEHEIAASAPVPKITNWLSRVPTMIESPSSPVTNEESPEDIWEAEEIGLSDSQSVVAEGSERKKIDQWRKACGH